MRKLLNTLFVTTPDTYLALDGENVVVYREEEILLRVPLHTLENILYFGYKGGESGFDGGLCGTKRTACICNAERPVLGGRYRKRAGECPFAYPTGARFGRLDSPGALCPKFCVWESVQRPLDVGTGDPGSCHAVGC